MSDTVALVVCPEAKIYDHGREHPLRPARVTLTWDLISAYGLDRLPNVSRVGCRPATDEQIGLVHSPAFIDGTKRAGNDEEGDWREFGYGPGDNPIFPRMHEAGALVAGASLVAADQVWSGRAEHSFNAAGGLHHAMASRASGFCVYNDPAIAIAWLLERGVERVAYLDLDVHHGDGVQAAFYADPRVLTASIHEFGPRFFPGTGSRDETGIGDGLGTCVNAPIEAGTGDARWLEVLRAELLPRVGEFRPEVLFTQLGADGYRSDPLASLNLTTGAYELAASDIHRLAHEVCGGRWVAMGGGGYSLTAAPRIWTLWFAEMCDAEPPDDLPLDWLENVRVHTGSRAPDYLRDRPGPDAG